MTAMGVAPVAMAVSFSLMVHDADAVFADNLVQQCIMVVAAMVMRNGGVSMLPFQALQIGYQVDQLCHCQRAPLIGHDRYAIDIS